MQHVDLWTIKTAAKNIGAGALASWHWLCIAFTHKVIRTINKSTLWVQRTGRGQITAVRLLNLACQSQRNYIHSHFSKDLKTLVLLQTNFQLIFWHLTFFIHPAGGHGVLTVSEFTPACTTDPHHSPSPPHWMASWLAAPLPRPAPPTQPVWTLAREMMSFFFFLRGHHINNQAQSDLVSNAVSSRTNQLHVRSHR